jgi:hypothetical protein
MKKVGKYLTIEKASADFLDNYKKTEGVNQGVMVDLALDTFKLREVDIYDMTDIEAKKMLRSAKFRLKILAELKTQLELRLED